MMAFRDRLLKAMKRKSIKQAELARMVDVGRSDVSRWLAGTQRPSYAHFLKLQELLRADLGPYPEQPTFGTGERAASDRPQPSRRTASLTPDNVDYLLSVGFVSGFDLHPTLSAARTMLRTFNRMPPEWRRLMLSCLKQNRDRDIPGYATHLPNAGMTPGMPLMRP